MGDSQVLYRMYDTAGDLLYVGVSMNVAQRFAAHRASKEWWTDIRQITLEHFATREDVLAAESLAIRTEFPRHNISDAPRHRPASVGPHDVAARVEQLTAHEARVGAATLELRALEADLRAARLEERAAIVAALDSGMKQVQVVAITGFTREHIRRLAGDEREARAEGA